MILLLSTWPKYNRVAKYAAVSDLRVGRCRR